MREHFYVPENYFLTHSVGCLPRGADTALTSEFLGPWKTGKNWQGWMGALDKFRAGVAKLLGVESSSICPQSNVSSGLTKILHSLPPHSSEKNVILLSKRDFPTIGFVVKQFERLGYRARFVDGDPADIDAWKRAIDETVAIVHITHALSNSSHLLPVGEICALARAANVRSIVDIAQSLGVVPVPIAKWEVDFAIGTGVKFLCCGPGACFLYAAPHILPRCEPIDVGWFSHENPFEMDIQNFRYAKDAMRFFGGTPSPAPLVLANRAIALWQEIGLEQVHRQIDAKLTALCNALPPDIIVSPISSGVRGGTLLINPGNREALRQAIAAQNIHCDERAEGFRFSVHGYTSEAELENLAQVISNRQ